MKKALASALIIAMTFLCACGANAKTIESLPENAELIWTYDADVGSGIGYWHDQFAVQGTGYLVVQVHDGTGTFNNLKITDAANSKNYVHIPSLKPGYYISETKTFDTMQMQFRFGKVENLNCLFDVYFVES